MLANCGARHNPVRRAYSWVPKQIPTATTTRPTSTAGHRLISTTSDRRITQHPSTGRLSRPQPRLDSIFSPASTTLLVGLVGITSAALYSTMSSKLIPQNPSDVMVIRNITPNVVALSVPFARVGIFKIGGRGTIVRMTSGALAVFSPVALTPEVKAKVQEMGGRLEYIVALDIEHHIFISEWAKEYPGVKIIGPEGLPEKREKMVDEKVSKDAFFTVFEKKSKLDKTITPEFDADFDYEYVDAHPNKELVFFYRPDKILIEADLMMNLPAKEQYSKVQNDEAPGILQRFFTSVQSTEGEAKGTKRFLWYAVSRADRPGFNASVKRIDAWDFTTIVPCHGDTIEGNGKEIFRKVFDWHLNDGTSK